MKLNGIMYVMSEQKENAPDRSNVKREIWFNQGKLSFKWQMLKQRQHWNME